MGLSPLDFEHLDGPSSTGACLRLRSAFAPHRWSVTGTTVRCTRNRIEPIDKCLRSSTVYRQRPATRQWPQVPRGAAGRVWPVQLKVVQVISLQ